MADLAEELKVYLKTKTAITSLVGTGTAARIYLHEAKQGMSLPFIVYEIYEGGSEEHLTAISGVATNRIQIDAYGATAALAFELAEVIRLAPLQMFRGAAGSITVLTVSSNGGYRRGYDPATQGGNQRRYWVSRDYIIKYRESTS